MTDDGYVCLRCLITDLYSAEQNLLHFDEAEWAAVTGACAAHSGIDPTSRVDS